MAISSTSLSFDDILARSDILHGEDETAIHPDRRTKLLSHGHKVDRAIVFLHGLTNCPIQFHKLGEMFHAEGANVLIPRMPYHGYRDRLTTAQNRLTQDDLRRWATEAVDLAQGLGERVTVAGISLGGVAAVWCGQSRADIDLAVAICPAFGIKGMGIRTNALIARLLRTLPPLNIWWNPAKREDASPEYTYPRFASHALANGFLFADVVLSQARKQAPAGRALRVFVSAGDPSVNNGTARKAVAMWQSHGRDAAYDSVNVGLIHDIIDANQPYQRVDKTYPPLIDFIYAGQMGDRG